MESSSSPSSQGPTSSSSRKKAHSSKLPAHSSRSYVIGCTAIATISSTLLGYDMGIMSGALLFVSEDLALSVVEQEVLVGSLSFVSLAGGAAAGRLADAAGRRTTMALSAGVFLAGALVMAFAQSFAILMLGRVLSGIAVGFALMIVPVYCAELAPAAIRGSLVSFSELSINFGILLGYVIDFAFRGLPSNMSWRLMLGFGVLPAILLAGGVLALPESPRWLVMRNRAEEARNILVKASGGDESEADLRLQGIIHSAGLAETGDPSEEAGPRLGRKQDRDAWRELLKPSPAVRRMMVAAFGIHFFHQACGIDAAVYYSPVVFSEAGITNKTGLLGATMGVGFVKFVFIFVATFLLDRVGRRPLLLVSCSGLALCLAAVAAAFVGLGLNSARGDTLISVELGHEGKGSHGYAGAAITIAAIAAYVAFFSVGLGPIAWLLASEIFPLRIRAQAMGAAVVVNRTVGGTVALTFLSLSRAITPAGVLFLFAGFAALSVAFVYVLVPETKGKTLEEITCLFDRRNPCREDPASAHASAG